MTGRTSLTAPVFTGGLDNILCTTLRTLRLTKNTEANLYFFLLLCSSMTNLLKIKRLYWYSGKSDTLFWHCVFSFNVEYMSTSKFLQKLTKFHKNSECNLWSVENLPKTFLLDIQLCDAWYRVKVRVRVRVSELAQKFKDQP